MNDLIVVQKDETWTRLKAIVLDSVPPRSPVASTTWRLTSSFLGGPGARPATALFKSRRECLACIARCSETRVVVYHRAHVGDPKIGRRSCTNNGLLAPEMAAGVMRVKSAKTKGVRAGNWLSLPQAQALLGAPDGSTNKGLRDRAILATLLGCGLRRSEVAALTFTHLQQRDGRWCIVDLVGKHQRVRTVPMPTWVKVAIDGWTAAAGTSDGSVFRRVDRADRVHTLPSARRQSGSCSRSMPKPLASLELHPMTVAVHVQSYPERLAASWSRFKCYWGMHQFKPRNAISARSRIWSMRPMMRSSCGSLFESF